MTSDSITEQAARVSYESQAQWRSGARLWSEATPGVRERRHCAHSDLEPIYGDQINMRGGWRLWCRTCSRYINGPVALAAARKGEPSA